MKNKYKVKLYTKWFEEPTSLSCEQIISYAYMYAESISEIEDRINRRFDGRKEIIRIEKID